MFVSPDPFPKKDPEKEPEKEPLPPKAKEEVLTKDALSA
jgi:hypothetical protein